MGGGQQAGPATREADRPSGLPAGAVRVEAVTPHSGGVRRDGRRPRSGNAAVALDDHGAEEAGQEGEEQHAVGHGRPHVALVTVALVSRGSVTCGAMYSATILKIK